MLIRALAVSLVAAVLGPAVGVGVFLVGNGDHISGETALPIEAAGPVPEFGEAQEEHSQRQGCGPLLSQLTRPNAEQKRWWLNHCLS